MKTAPKKTTVSSLHRQIEGCKKRIGIERDKLRELIDDAQAIEDDCDDAIGDLERAVDCLSKYL